ncbi:MAG TPA: DUF4402 domain-containing protein [Balneolaceae bacterium]
MFAANPVLAQENVSISVSAKVVSSVELLTIQSLKLSQAEVQNGQIRIDPLNSANAAKMIAIGNPNSDIRISFIKARELTHRESPETLLFHYRVAGNSVNDQTTAELLNQDNRDFEFNSNGKFFIWIGGSVDISNAAPGNYQGEFTIEIVYI